MTREEIANVVAYILFILSGAILIDILMGKIKDENPQKKADEVILKAKKEAYKKMQNHYPQIVNG